MEVGDFEREGGRTLHDVGGTLSFPNPTTILVSDFHFDGGGLGKM